MISKFSIFELFAAPIQVLRPFRLQPRRVVGRPMPTKKFEEGVISFNAFRAAYLQPKTKRVRYVATDQLDSNGKFVLAQVPVREPWRRVTPKAVRPGFVRRVAARAAA